MIKFIYFDMGRVLLNYDFSKTADAITAQTGKDGRDVIERLATNYIDLWSDFELGAISPEDFFGKIQSIFQLSMSFEALKKAYNEIFTIKQDTFELVKKLKEKNYRLGVLSNTSQPHWEYVQATFPELFSQFEILLGSYEMRLAKPDKAIYFAAAQAAGVKPSEILFFDDLAPNIAGAKAAGFDAVQFFSADQAEKELKARGLL